MGIAQARSARHIETHERTETLFCNLKHRSFDVEKLLVSCGVEVWHVS
jgi:hypothetical protein